MSLILDLFEPFEKMMKCGSEFQEDENSVDELNHILKSGEYLSLAYLEKKLSPHLNPQLEQINGKKIILYRIIDKKESEDFFPTPQIKKELYEITNNLTDYIYDNNINNIMLIDCSARPLYIAIRKLWKNKFPKLKQPQIYFTNPEAYQTSMSFETQDHNNHYLKKFENTYKKLAKKKEEKLLLFDMCAHTGDTLRPIINLLKYNEYNVVVGIAQKNPLFEEIVFDFIALNRECRLKCSPFGIEHMVSKNGFKMLSSPNQNKGNAIQLRKQISKIIDEFS